MDAFTDIGWFLYISLDSYKVWMHLQTLYHKCILALWSDRLRITLLCGILLYTCPLKGNYDVGFMILSLAMRDQEWSGEEGVACEFTILLCACTCWYVCPLFVVCPIFETAEIPQL